MVKSDIEFILKNGSTMSLKALTDAINVPPRTIRKFMKKNNIKHFRTQSLEHRKKANETRAVTSKKRLEEIKHSDLTPWPKITTTMSEAMRYKSYGGNTSLPGTKNPIEASAVYSINVGTFKSSMIW
jgi:hypothetical protein